MLFARKLHDQFARCARMLLTPYFYEIHRLAVDRVRRERSIGMFILPLLDRRKKQSQNVGILWNAVFWNYSIIYVHYKDYSKWENFAF